MTEDTPANLTLRMLRPRHPFHRIRQLTPVTTPGSHLVDIGNQRVSQEARRTRQIVECLQTRKGRGLGRLG